jgi:uncharacterized cupin superfamily protein
MQRANIFDVECEYDGEDPEGYRSARARLAPKLGMEQLGGSVFELPPGQSICPYHWHAGEEELLIVLSGSATVRHPEGEVALAAGDAVCFPAGAVGAHKVTNKTEQTVRVLMLSTNLAQEICVYPDSDKVGAFGSGIRLLFRSGDAVDYYEGETG